MFKKRERRITVNIQQLTESFMNSCSVTNNKETKEKKPLVIPRCDDWCIAFEKLSISKPRKSSKNASIQNTNSTALTLWDAKKERRERHLNNILNKVYKRKNANEKKSKIRRKATSASSKALALAGITDIVTQMVQEMRISWELAPITSNQWQLVKAEDAYSPLDISKLFISKPTLPAITYGDTSLNEGTMIDEQSDVNIGNDIPMEIQEYNNNPLIQLVMLEDLQDA